MQREAFIIGAHPHLIMLPVDCVRPECQVQQQKVRPCPADQDVVPDTSIYNVIASARVDVIIGQTARIQPNVVIARPKRDMHLFHVGDLDGARAVRRGHSSKQTACVPDQPPRIPRQVAHVEIEPIPAINNVGSSVTQQSVIGAATAQDVVKIAADQMIFGMRSSDVDHLETADLNVVVLVKSPVCDVPQPQLGDLIQMLGKASVRGAHRNLIIARADGIGPKRQIDPQDIKPLISGQHSGKVCPVQDVFVAGTGRRRDVTGQRIAANRRINDRDT